MVVSTRRRAKQGTTTASDTNQSNIKEEQEETIMPTASRALRASPVTAEPKPAPSPPPEEPEDERQYMMLRHSDDEAHSGNGYEGAAAGHGAAQNDGGSGNGEEPDVIPKSPDRIAQATGGALRSMRGRGGPAPGTVPRQVSQQYEQRPPMPFRLGGPAPEVHHGGPPSYARGVSEDPGAHASFPPPGEQYYPYEQYYDPNMALSAAPSWGLIDGHMGTFDYGEVPEHPAYPHQQQQGGTNIITPAQTIRKTGGRGAPPGVAQYMYPPSSPIKAGPSPKASPEPSPQMARSPKVEDESEEELAAEWIPPKGNAGTRRIYNSTERYLPEAVHVPPPPTAAAAAAAAAASEVIRARAQPQFVSRQPSHAPVSSAGPPGASTLAAAGTPPRYRPPLVSESSPSRSADSSESPGHSLQGGRVQLVGGGIGETGTPWSLISRSQSAEESAGSHGGHGWEPPPRPDRRPMVPPAGRPAANGASPPRPGRNQYSPHEYRGRGPPPPPSHSGYYPGYEYCDNGSHERALPAPPSIQRSSSSHSCGSGRSAGAKQTARPGYPASYSPERPRSSSSHPQRQGAYPPGYHYPYPPQYYHSSQYPPHYASYPGGPPPHQEDVEDVVHPLLKDYNPHRDGIRPQFTNVKKSKESMTNKRKSAMSNAGGTSAMIGPHGNLVPAGGVSPKRRRRRDPSEKAAAAAAMAAAAAASMRERKVKDAAKKEESKVSVTTAKPTASRPSVIGVAGGVAIAGGFSEEELKTLGSGDDEDIPAAKRAAMASAVALRAAAGGSPVEPPKSAKEVQFDIADPPMSPVCPPSHMPVLESATLMTENDVLCGRGGGTNSQMGNRRFRALVRDFQPTYLMAKRREKPKMARSVVLIVRNRGGRFLRRDESDGRLYEVGDEKAEAKTSQALREGLDVRATKTAANTLMGAATADSPNKKRKTNSPPAKPKATEKSEAVTSSKEKSPPTVAKPEPIHNPGYSQPPNHRPSRPPPPPPASSARPRSADGPPPPPPPPGYYYPPRYSDPYYRGQYPTTAAAEYGYGPPPTPGSAHHPGPYPVAAAQQHHHPHYGGPTHHHPVYPPHHPYAGYPVYGPPSPPRTARAPPPPVPHSTPIISGPKTLT